MKVPSRHKKGQHCLVSHAAQHGGVLGLVVALVVPYLTVSSESLVLDNQNADIAQRHHIKQGPVLIDLTALDSSTTIVPYEAERTFYRIGVYLLEP